MKFDKDEDGYTEVSFRAKGDGLLSLMKVLRHCEITGNQGHSHSIIIDPDTTEENGKRTVGWDGDGSDRISDIKVNGKSLDEDMFDGDHMKKAGRKAMSMNFIAKRLLALAKELVAQNEGFELTDLQVAVAEYLGENPSPKDDDFHKWAEGEGYDVDEAEAAAYHLATLAVTFLLHGRANDKKLKAEKVDKDELAKGVKVEMEHTSSKEMATRIALDHLAEIPDSPLGYYTGLSWLEKLMESLSGMSEEAAKKKMDRVKKVMEE